MNEYLDLDVVGIKDTDKPADITAQIKKKDKNINEVSIVGGQLHLKSSLPLNDAAKKELKRRGFLLLSCPMQQTSKGTVFQNIYVQAASAINPIDHEFIDDEYEEVPDSAYTPEEAPSPYGDPAPLPRFRK